MRACGLVFPSVQPSPLAVAAAAAAALPAVQTAANSSFLNSHLPPCSNLPGVFFFKLDIGLLSEGLTGNFKNLLPTRDCYRLLLNSFRPLSPVLCS
jgi:hypothetical protein